MSILIRPAGVVTFAIFPPPRYDAPERAVALYQRVAGAIAALPGVKEVALSNHLPLSGDTSPSIEIPGVPRRRERSVVLFRTISAEYFATMRIPCAAAESYGERRRIASIGHHQ